MSKINLTRKTFLEKEELNRFQDFLEYNSTRHVTLSNTTNWGIVRSNFSSEDLNFKVELGANIGSIKVNKEISYALDKDGLLINLPQTLNFAIPNDNQWYWLRVSHQYRRFEEGYVNVDSLGSISGTNTKFTQTLRGQATEVPTKIRFIRDDGQTLINTGTYEIIDIGSDIIAAATSVVGFTAESNLRMIVIGATPISESVTAEQLEGLYKYDGCLLKYVLEVSGEPTLTADKQFHIARVKNNAGSVTIEDKRTQYWSSNVPGVSDRLSKFENLDDLANKTEARSNLDVYSKSEADAAFGGTTDVSDFARKSQNLNDLTDKTTARSNLGVYEKTESDSRYMKMSNTIGNDYFNWVIEDVGGDGNTSRISLIMGDDIDSSQSFQIRNAAGSSAFEIDSVGVSHFGTPVSISNGGTGGNTPSTARANLGVYSAGDVDTLDGLRLAKANNLSDLQNTSTARDNLGVYDKVYVDKYRPFAVGTVILPDIGLGGSSIGQVLTTTGDFEFAKVTDSVASSHIVIIVRRKAEINPLVVNQYRANITFEDPDDSDTSCLIAKFGRLPTTPVDLSRYVSILIRETNGGIQTGQTLHLELINTY